MKQKHNSENTDVPLHTKFKNKVNTEFYFSTLTNSTYKLCTIYTKIVMINMHRLTQKDSAIVPAKGCFLFTDQIILHMSM